METQNVTFRVPKALLAQVKKVAVERGTSVTALVIESLTRLASGNEAYDAAKERQLALMLSGKRLRSKGEELPKREALHDR